jgi:hypothetical protein
MQNHTVTIPELSMIAGTRAMAGAGIALLLADRLAPPQRRAIGWTLTLVGAVMTIPLAMDFLFAPRSGPSTSNHSAKRPRRRLAPAHRS